MTISYVYYNISFDKFLGLDIFNVPLMLVYMESCNRLLPYWYTTHSVSMLTDYSLLLSLTCWHKCHLVFYGYSNRNLWLNYIRTVPFLFKMLISALSFVEKNQIQAGKRKCVPSPSRSLRNWNLRSQTGWISRF